MDLIEKPLRLKLLQKTRVDEFFRFFASRRRDPLGDLFNCVTDAFKVGMSAVVGDLKKTFMSCLEDFRVGDLEIFCDRLLGLVFVRRREVDTVDKTLKKGLNGLRLVAVEAIRGFDHELRVRNPKVAILTNDIQALFFCAQVQRTNGGLPWKTPLRH
jgi:hypothetical protein